MIYVINLVGDQFYYDNIEKYKYIRSVFLNILLNLESIRFTVIYIEIYRIW